jgi:hypothetical protein
MTRATLALVRGDYSASLRFHPVALPASFGLLLAVVLAFGLPEGHPLWPRFTRAALTALALALACVWLLRLAGILPSLST